MVVGVGVRVPEKGRVPNNHYMLAALLPRARVYGIDGIHTYIFMYFNYLEKRGFGNLAPACEARMPRLPSLPRIPARARQLFEMWLWKLGSGLINQT